MEQREDVVVVGAGVVGLCSALALIEAGRGVRVLDAGRVGGGSSHGNCGTITPSHAPPLAAPGMVATALRMMLTPDAPLYIRPRLDPTLWRWLLRFAGRCNLRDWEASARAKSVLLNDSRIRLQQWVGQYALECDFHESGEDYVYRDPRRFAHGQREIGLLRDLGIDVEVLEGRDYEALEPAVKPGVAGAIRFSGDAALRPDRYVAELARAVTERGGVVVENDPLRRAMQPGKGYSITYSAPPLVPRRPLVLRERSVCVTAWGDAGACTGFRLGSTMEFSGFDDQLNPRRLAALERGAAEYLHQPVGPQVQEQWCGWRPMSCDDVPIIGRAPGHGHLWLATGHGMMGVGMSSGTGQLVADLMTGRAPAVDPAPYRPDRFA